MLEPLQAERQLLAIEVVTVPNMKPADSASTMRRYFSRLDKTRSRAKTMTEALMAAGIAVVHVPTEREPPPRATGHERTRRKGKRGRATR